MIIKTSLFSQWYSWKLSYVNYSHIHQKDITRSLLKSPRGLVRRRKKDPTTRRIPWRSPIHVLTPPDRAWLSKKETGTPMNKKKNKISYKKTFFYLFVRKPGRAPMHNHRIISRQFSVQDRVQDCVLAQSVFISVCMSGEALVCIRGFLWK